MLDWDSSGFPRELCVNVCLCVRDTLQQTGILSRVCSHLASQIHLKADQDEILTKAFVRQVTSTYKFIYLFLF